VDTGTECILKTLDTVDTILLGRATYEDLSRPSKWPSVKDWPGVKDLHLQLGEKINNAHKLVVTDDLSLDELKWGDFEAPTRLSGDNLEEQIKELKNGEGGDIVIFGSPTLVRALTDANLIDEYQVQVHPVVVNVGEHLFDNLKERKHFHLIEAKSLEDGSLFVRYAPAKT
jgi:dihydrofolate reductase